MRFLLERVSRGILAVNSRACITPCFVFGSIVWLVLSLLRVLLSLSFRRTLRRTGAGVTACLEPLLGAGMSVYPCVCLGLNGESFTISRLWFARTLSQSFSPRLCPEVRVSVLLHSMTFLLALLNCGAMNWKLWTSTE